MWSFLGIPDTMRGMKTVRLHNATRGTDVAAHVRVADSFCTRFFGLMGKPGLGEGEGLWLKPCSQVHSCFMRFEFDVLFLDKNGQVLHIEPAMKPWAMSRWVRGGHSVVELATGAAAASQTQVGDQLEAG